MSLVSSLRSFLRLRARERAHSSSHKSDVQKWLDIIQGQYMPKVVEGLKTGSPPPFPIFGIAGAFPCPCASRNPAQESPTALAVDHPLMLTSRHVRQATHREDNIRQCQFLPLESWLVQELKEEPRSSKSRQAA